MTIQSKIAIRINTNLNYINFNITFNKLSIILVFKMYGVLKTKI